jgi:uncharacterized integral membrane protein
MLFLGNSKIVDFDFVVGVASSPLAVLYLVLHVFNIDGLIIAVVLECHQVVI